MKNFCEKLWQHLEQCPIINTHSHHLPDQNFDGFDLDTLLRRSYVDWCGVHFDETRASKLEYLDRVKYKSYFVWLQKSLQNIYRIDEPLSGDNWESISKKVQKAHLDKKFHLELLQKSCGYQKIILDTYWEPGSDNGHPELFFPTYRIDMFLFGYDPEVKDPDGNNALKFYNEKIVDIDEYVSFMAEKIRQKKEDGCIALKSAIAYGRGLDFNEVSREQASKVFARRSGEPTKEEIKAFQDYLFFQVCRIAADLKLPLQCHTGLGQLGNTNPMQLQEVIVKNPDTQFVLFHCGYPWLDDLIGLLHVYSNVYPDLCWLPLITPSAAQRMVAELIEAGAADKICWGCDTWTSEESFGALLAIRHVLTGALAIKVAEGYLSPNDAQMIAENILYNNAHRLYRI